MYKCICGFTGNRGAISSHKKKCAQHKAELDKIYSIKNLIVEEYKNKHAIADLVFDYNVEYFGDIKDCGSAIIGIVREILKEDNVYAPYGKESSRVRQKKIQKTLKEKYGVVNVGQLPGYGWKNNDVPYKKIPYLYEDFEEYRKEVNRLTKINVRKIKIKPKYCEYTGVIFADEESNRVNPNDARKRTVDHVIPVIICYLNHVPAEKAASISNIKFCLRYVNNIKQNTLLESFLPIAAIIRKIFKDEGYECKDFGAEAHTI